MNVYDFGRDLQILNRHLRNEAITSVKPEIKPNRFLKNIIDTTGTKMSEKLESPDYLKGISEFLGIKPQKQIDSQYKYQIKDSIENQKLAVNVEINRRFINSELDSFGLSKEKSTGEDLKNAYLNEKKNLQAQVQPAENKTKKKPAFNVFKVFNNLRKIFLNNI